MWCWSLLLQQSLAMANGIYLSCMCSPWWTRTGSDVSKRLTFGAQKIDAWHGHLYQYDIRTCIRQSKVALSELEWAFVRSGIPAGFYDVHCKCHAWQTLHLDLLEEELMIFVLAAHLQMSSVRCQPSAHFPAHEQTGDLTCPRHPTRGCARCSWHWGTTVPGACWQTTQMDS